MRRLSFLFIISLLCSAAIAQATELQPRLVFDKYLFAEGVNPQARNLQRLIVKFFDEDQVRLRDGELRSLRDTDISQAQAFLVDHPEITLKLYMARTSEVEYQERIAALEAKSGIDLVDLFSFHVFRLPEVPADPKALLAEILRAPEVEIAYYESIPVDATCTDIGWTTPDFIPNQTYHDSAPLGTDLDFAQLLFGADVVDGSGTGTWTGIFERGMQTTHEDVTYATVSTLGTPDANNDHGTAVMGILGSCDDNNVGALGYLADQRMVLYQRNSGSYGSVAEVYDEANSELLAGEVTNSSWGYYSDPMPPGQTCPSNPGQNGCVPCEYDPGVKASIQAGVALGIHYFICAHNGCTDLDDPVFGTTFDWSTDTGSIIVGACESAVSGDGHDAISWTSYGSRLTSFCWGEDIYTAGYGLTYGPGTGWEGSGDRDEWYYYDFGGTSGATPIVAGCGGVLNNIWRDQHTGDNIAPGTLRDWLQINPTPNTDASVDIGVMPNLFGILAPDLAPYQPGGWDAEIVPNNTAGDHTIPANLLPEPTETYFGWAYRNESHFAVADPATSMLYRDDVARGSTSTTLNPRVFGYVNAFSQLVRGGNHYWKLETDYNDDLTEGDETNNTFVEMYVWDGIQLTADVPVTYTRGPKKDPEGVSWYAKDGFYNGGNPSGFWEVWAVMPEINGDYDMFLHNVTPTATSGFTIYQAYSGTDSGPDIVGQNTNAVADGDWCSILNYNDTDDDYTIEMDGSNYLGHPPVTQLLADTETLAGGEILDIYETHLDAGEEVWFKFDCTGGTADVTVFFYGPSSDYFDRGDYVAYYNSGLAGESESGIFTATETGFHGFLICKNHYDYLNASYNYDLYWGPPQGDLTHTVRSGWDYELVARNDGVGSVGIVPAILNEGDSDADNGYLNIGTGTFQSGSNTAFYLDGPQTDVSGNFVINVAPGGTTYLSSKDLGYVKGGRHETGARIDINGEVAEELPDGENNNHFYKQYCWAPYTLANRTPAQRSPAPNFRNSQNPDAISQPNSNQDGYAFSDAFWTAVAVTPHHNDDWLNIGGYDYHSTDPEDAYLNGVSVSFPGYGTTGFVMMNGNIMNGVRDFGIRNNFVYPATLSLDDYSVEGCQRLQDLSGSQPYGPFTIPSGNIIHTFDIHLSAGTTYPVLLGNESAADIGIAIFDAGAVYAGMTEAQVFLDSNGAGLGESGSITPISTGFHGVAVFKHGTDDLFLDATYRVRIGLTYPPDAITDLTIEPYDFSPGNAIVEITFTPVTTDVWGFPLEVDFYRLYTTQYEPYDFSGAYVEDLWPVLFNDGNGLLYYDVLGWFDSAFLHLTAVDEDGFLLNPPPGIDYNHINDTPNYEPDRRLLSTPPAASKTHEIDR